MTVSEFLKRCADREQAEEGKEGGFALEMVYYLKRIEERYAALEYEKDIAVVDRSHILHYFERFICQRSDDVIKKLRLAATDAAKPALAIEEAKFFLEHEDVELKAARETLVMLNLAATEEAKLALPHKHVAVVDAQSRLKILKRRRSSPRFMR